ncbi:MAG: glycosyltransferase [Bdellovibrionales bacterium]|nr:glycosyltransferase [Bdellovibrionales bacterium]
MADVKISIVIPTRSKGLQTLETIQSCQRQAFDKAQYELIVVGHFENRLLCDLTRQPQFSNFTYSVCSNIGVNHARNHGLTKATGDIVLFLDDDCRLPRENYLADLWKAHQIHHEICVIGGKYQSSQETNLWGQLYNEMVNCWISSHHQKPLKVLPGGNCSFKRKLLNQRQFESKIRYGGSETEFLIRLQKQGEKLLFLESLTVYHDSQIPFRSVLSKAWQQGKNRSQYQLPKGSLHLPRGLNAQTLTFLAGYKIISEMASTFKKIEQKLGSNH